MKAIFGVLALASAVLLVGACASARRSEPITGNTLENNAALAEGRRVFIQHCHTCHPGGEAGLGPALNNKPLPQSLLKFQVRHGLGTMPAFKEDQINSADLNALAAYLVALRRSD
jgi:mono/diheme cytochrome c family protein